MNMAKTLDAVQVIPISGIPICINRIVRTQIDHAEWTGCGIKKEPSGIGSIYQWIDQVHRIKPGTLCPVAPGQNGEKDANTKYHASHQRCPFHLEIICCQNSLILMLLN